MRAGEGESEAENYVLTNPVAKTSMSSGLSQRGKTQVRLAVVGRASRLSNGAA